MAMAVPFGRPWFRRTLVALSSIYVGSVFLDGIGSTLAWKVLPRPVHYFVEVSRLFPDAQPVAIDYRAEAWVCSDRKFEELDTRDYFPLRAGDKENRFYRFVQFYRHSRPAMEALEDYLVRRDTAQKIGGIRVLSLRIPLPAPGAPVERWHRKPLSDYPQDERHAWFWTPRSRRAQRCGSGEGGTEP